jgi:phage terminase large subunit GpA-like protein
LQTTILNSPRLMREMKATIRKVLRNSVTRWAPPLRMPIREWATRHRYLSAIEAGRPGKYVLEVTPYLAWENGPLDALQDPLVREVVCRKSAQVAWTSGVIGNALGAWIDTDPSPILMLFPKEQDGKDYMLEKFEPMVEATPRLRDKVDLHSRKLQQTQTRKRFPGGFLKIVGSNSPGSVKSSPVPRVIVEEPDDCNLNLRGQGDSIKLAKERVKTYTRSIVVFGGTPTVVGLSAIDEEMKLSDCRVGMIPCHACGEEHALSFDNLHCREDDTQNHPVFGGKLPETAFYACPHCGAHWNDSQKNRNVRGGRWVATAQFRGIVGYNLNELYSPFPGSSMAILMEKWLTAQHEFELGNVGPLIAFVNSSKGEAYEFQNDGPSETDLADRAEDYDAKTVPEGGLILTAGIDIQHDWIELVIRAWGRGEESWLVLHERLHGKPGLKEDAVWIELDKLVFGIYRHARGFGLGITAASIDSSDGNTSDAVYHWVRSRQNRGVQYLMAIKGSKNPDQDIFTKPSPVKDMSANNTKSAKYGLRVYMVGVSRAKDLLIGERGRIGLTGNGPARFHVYREGLAGDYFKQLTAEVKAPLRQKNGTVKRVWQKKVGERNEVLDCEGCTPCTPAVPPAYT